MQHVFRYLVYRSFNAVRALPEQKTGRPPIIFDFLQLIQDESVFQ